MSDPCGYVDHEKMMCECVEGEISKLKEANRVLGKGLWWYSVQIKECPKFTVDVSVAKEALAKAKEIME